MDSKKLALVALALIMTALAFYAGYHISRDQPQAQSTDREQPFNPFHQIARQASLRQNPDIPLSPFELHGPLVRYASDNFSPHSLPVYIQEQIYASSFNHYQETRNTLLDFLIRLHVAAQEHGDDFDLELLPSAEQFYSDLVSMSEVEELYQANLDVFPPHLEPMSIKHEIYLELLSQKVSEYFLENIKSLIVNDIASLIALPPRLPYFSLEYNDYFSLSTGDDEVKTVLISQFFCDDCRKYFLDFAKIFQDDELKMNFYFALYTDNLDSPDVIANHISHCIYKESPNEFWKYYYKLMTLSDEQVSSLPDDSESLYRFFLSLASDLKLNNRQLSQCAAMTNDETLQSSLSHMDKFKSLGISAIPAIFVNDRFFDPLVHKDLPTGIRHLHEHAEGR